VPNWSIADSVIKLFNGGEAFYTAAKNLGSNYVVKYIQKGNVSSSLWNFISNKMEKWNIRVVMDENNLKVIQLLNIEKENVPISFKTLKDSLRELILEKRHENFSKNALDSLKINYNVTTY